MSDVSSRLASALVDRYRIERELGAGGMATVYLAEDLKHDRKVAIKVLKPELAAVLGAERFVVEIKTTAAMSHPHILPLFDSGTADGFLFYVMPYIQGETIREKLNRETQFGVDEAVRIAREVADALDYAHRHGVIHRDIKPENILLHDGRAMVMDFGIALAVSAAAGGRMTETGLSLGTPHYMSPEQATAEKEITARSDQYSLGSVLYEMLAGQPPHNGGAAQQVIMKIITEQAQPVHHHRRNVPANVDAALAKALEKLPADRFESVAKFAEALVTGGFFHGTTGSAYPVPARAPSWRDPRTLVAGLSLLVAATALGVLLKRPAADGAPLTISTLLPPEGEVWRRNGGAAVFALSPDGRKLAVVDFAANPNGIMVLRSLDTTGTVAINGTEGARVPFWSPDGRSIGFFAEGQLKRVDVPAGHVQVLCPAPQSAGGTWNSKGEILFQPAIATPLHVVAATGGECRPLRLTGLDSTHRLKPFFLPDGRSFIAGATTRTYLGALGEDSVTQLELHTTTAAFPVLAWPNVLLLPEGGPLYAQHIDLRGKRVLPEKVPIIDRVTNNSGEVGVSVSTNGTMVAVGPGESVERLLLMGDLDTPRVDSLALSNLSELLSISPTSGRIVTSGWALRAIDPARRTSTRLAVEPGGARMYMPSVAWAPADSMLAITRNVPPGILRYDLRTGRSTVWIDDPKPGRRLVVNDWSPDGRTILVEFGSAAASPTSEVWSLDTRTDSLTPLIVDRGNVGDARYSPDGRWIAYRSDADGRAEVYLRPSSGDGLPVKVSTKGGTAPRWGGDSRKLFFQSLSDEVMAAPISADGTVGAAVVARPDRWTGFEVMPDGRRLVSVAASGARPGLELIVNWPQILARHPRD